MAVNYHHSVAPEEASTVVETLCLESTVTLTRQRKGFRYWHGAEPSIKSTGQKLKNAPTY